VGLSGGVGGGFIGLSVRAALRRVLMVTGLFFFFFFFPPAHGHARLSIRRPTSPVIFRGSQTQTKQEGVYVNVPLTQFVGRYSQLTFFSEVVPSYSFFFFFPVGGYLYCYCFVIVACDW
jgi:hypothetical protein